jgi:Amt family ammonium transporter
VFLGSECHADRSLYSKARPGIRRSATAVCALLAFGMAGPAFGADELDTGDTAWVLISTALVLFMTVPGLALFYGGLVRTKNVLSVLMQCFALTAVISIPWSRARAVR